MPPDAKFFQLRPRALPDLQTRTLILRKSIESFCESIFVDLSFSRFEPDGVAIALPADLAVLLVGIAARQANSPTALIGACSAMQAKQEDLLRPAHGAFNRAMAAMICRWKQE